MDARILTLSTLSFLIVCAAFSSAVPTDYLTDDDLFFLRYEKDPFRRFLENNDVEPLHYGDAILKNIDTNNKVCNDFYGSTCNRIQSDSKNFEKNMENEFSKFMFKFMNLLDKKLKNDYLEGTSAATEKKLYLDCLLLGERSIDSDNSEDYINSIIDQYQEEHEENKDNEFEKKSGTDNNEDEESKDNESDNVKRGDISYENTVNMENNPSWVFIEGLFNKIVANWGKNFDQDTWQELDQKLASFGFGHTFFDIKVRNDPLQPDQNIIILEPPSIKEWNAKKLPDMISLIHQKLLNNAFSYCVEKYSSLNAQLKKKINKKKSKVKNESPFLESNEVESEESNEYRPEDFGLLCNRIADLTEYNVDEMRRFKENIPSLYVIMDIIEYIMESVEVRNKNTLDKRYTINEWNTIYNGAANYANKRETVELNWLAIIQAEFAPLNIRIHNNEYILVKNIPYFIRLATYLSIESNENLVDVVRSKFVADNIRYHDWHFVESIMPQNKSSFCLNDTKLYGISESTMAHITKLYLHHNRVKSQKVLDNIVKVLNHNISESQTMTDAEKAYLKSKLKGITENIFGNELTSNYISDYYGNYDISSDNYLIDITYYRKLLKNKELRGLKSHTPFSYAHLPFSINELDNPRSRFKLHALLSMAINSANSVNIETYYATYGVRMAGFLYSLLKENKTTDVMPIHKSELLTAHAVYPHEVIKCFIPKNVVEYGSALAYATVTEIFSVKIAYEAMLSDEENNSIKNFITAYTQAQCNVSKPGMLKTVLSNIEEELSTAFECKNIPKKHKKCHKTAF